MIWKNKASPESLDANVQQTLLGNLGITFTAIGDDFIEATMPVDRRTIQPFGILHGGASVALAESLGSFASHLCIENTSTHMPVGVEINANHLRPVPDGQHVVGKVTPVKLGRRIHVWQIDIRDPEGRLACTSRMTIAIIERPS